MEASDNPVGESDSRLQDHVDWGYLLREYYELYRFLPAGGSSKIRSHQRAVREAINKVQRSNPPMFFARPETKPVVAHLARALDEGLGERYSAFIRAIRTVSGGLSWQYGYDRMPRGLAEKYAYAEIAGPMGPVVTDRIILGLVLFAPGTTYPAHSHAGISESYVCLSGSVSENDHGVFAPGSLIFNPPDHSHRITVSALEPALLVYSWQGPRENLAGQKMKFSRARPNG